jgi:hypothetical protein
MSQVLFKARDLRARDFVAEDAKRLAAYGLDKPADPALRLGEGRQGAEDPAPRARPRRTAPTRRRSGR